MVFLGIDWGKIFSIPFWLDVNPGELSDRFEKIFLVILLISYGFYFISKYYQKRLVASRNFIKAKFWHKVGTYGLVMAVSFTFLFFFRYEAIPILGGRFWILLWIIGGVIWFAFLAKFYFIEVPEQLKDLELRQRQGKYMVKPKR